MNTHLTRLQHLLHIPSPSGYEQRSAAALVEIVNEIGFSAETDPSGNVIVRLAGQDPTRPLHCYASHMDEIGLVVTAIEPDGTLRVRRSGGLFPFKHGEGMVELLGDAQTIQTVLSMGSMHRADAADLTIRWQDVRLITGLTPGQLNAAGIRPGTPGVPPAHVRGPHLFGDPADPLVAAWTFDDRLGCVCLLGVLEQLRATGRQPLAPTLIVFTVAEEVGGLGAKSVSLRERPDVFIAVDGSPMPPETALTLDGRPCAWARDRLGPYDRALLERLRISAENANTQLQTAAYSGAASDASLVRYAGLVPRAACFGHVRANSHGYEVIRLSVIDNVINTLLDFTQRAGEQRSTTPSNPT